MFSLQDIKMAALIILPNCDTEQHINNLFSFHIHHLNKVNSSIYQHHIQVIPPPHFHVNMNILKDASEENTTVKMRKLWTKSQPGDIRCTDLIRASSLLYYEKVRGHLVLFVFILLYVNLQCVSGNRKSACGGWLSHGCLFICYV